MLKKGSILLALITVLWSFGVAAAHAGEILGRDIWTVGNSHEYVVVEFPEEIWDNANSDVNNLLPGYHLATITNQEEQDFVIDLLVRLGTVQQYWLGGFQDPITEPLAAEGWTWITSEEWDYTNWGSGEPNDGGGPGGEQHLALDGSRGWNDEGSAIGAIFGYIAELSNIALDPFVITEAKIEFNDNPQEEGFKLKGGFTLGKASDGIDPSNEDVAVEVGASSITIPAGSFIKDDGAFDFEGIINSADIRMRIEAEDETRFNFKAKVKQVDLTDTANPMGIALRVGNEKGVTQLRFEGKLKFKD